MPTEPHTPARGRHLDALRAAALNPQGVRHEAYPTAMPVLRELGYVGERPAKDRRGRGCSGTLRPRGAISWSRWERSRDARTRSVSE
jgi:hypothetical protein